MQGPCPSGQLFIASQCICNSNLTMHYYEERQECYQLYTQGPCSTGQIMTFNYLTRKPQCVCRDEHVLSHDGNCYQVNTVGPCNQTACPKVSSFSCSLFQFVTKFFFWFQYKVFVHRTSAFFPLFHLIHIFLFIIHLFLCSNFDFSCSHHSA